MERSHLKLIFGLVFLIGACAGSSGFAQPVADFYRGKVVRVYVASGAGAYDLYTRVLIREFAQHVPGQPTIIVQNMPGAGGVKAVNYFYNVAPRDGGAMLVPLKPLAMTQILRPKRVKYDASELNWVGSMVDAPGALAVWHTAPAKSFADARKFEVVMAASGFGAETFIFPTVINSVLGSKFKVITGYRGLSRMYQAMEQGEVQGVSTVYGSMLGLKPNWLRDKKVRFIIQVATKRIPELPDVPTVLDFARTDEQKEILTFLTLGNVIGRSIVASPGIPTDRLVALRAAFDKTTASPAYLAETKKRRMLINSTPGTVVQQAVKRLIATPKKIVDKVRAALAAAPKLKLKKK